MIGVREPLFLLFCLLAIPVFFLTRMTVGRLRFSSLGILPKGAATLRARLVWVPDSLVALSVVVFGVALAGPRLEGGSTRVQREGIAIMMAVDISGSMKALDLATNGVEDTRLDVVQDVFVEFVEGNPDDGLEGRPDDAIGLVSFARNADAACPLTLDHGNLVSIAKGLEIVTQREDDGTAIGDALGLAVERLRESEVSSRIIILLTDGVNNAGEDSPLEAAQLAKTLGIKVYAIGAGTNGLAPVRATDPFSGREVLTQMRVEIDESTLRQIADSTGGRYFRATDGDSLREVYREIDGLEKSRVTEDRIVEYDEYYDFSMGLALLIACSGWLLGASLFRRLP
ncbi:MAG: aerotolerance regulator BatA [Deltaproteobacteria bacterium CG_4_9_14_3_um_filter_63_12]|nr:MAG: aerotolerance regulator BatA [Deltaproteobacteria bacterium CG_4_9_14_3_um_filter_63_12]